MIRKWLSEITPLNLSIFSITSAAGGALTYLFGPWNKLFAGLFILMVADVITGVMKAIAKKSEKTTDGSLESSAGILGLFKKAGVLISILVVYVMGYMFLPDINQAILARDAAICGFGFFEAKSIFENLDKLGFKIIPFIKKFMNLIKKKVDSMEPETQTMTEELISDEEEKNEESEEVNS